MNGNVDKWGHNWTLKLQGNATSSQVRAKEAREISRLSKQYPQCYVAQNKQQQSGLSRNTHFHPIFLKGFFWGKNLISRSTKSPRQNRCHTGPAKTWHGDGSKLEYRLSGPTKCSSVWDMFIHLRINIGWIWVCANRFQGASRKPHRHFETQPPCLRRVPLRPAIGLLRVSHLHHKQWGCSVYHETSPVDFVCTSVFCIPTTWISWTWIWISDDIRWYHMRHVRLCSIHIYMHIPWLQYFNSALGAKPGPSRTSQAFLPAPWPLANTAGGAQIDQIQSFVNVYACVTVYDLWLLMNIDKYLNNSSQYSAFMMVWSVLIVFEIVHVCVCVCSSVYLCECAVP